MCLFGWKQHQQRESDDDKNVYSWAVKLLWVCMIWIGAKIEKKWKCEKMMQNPIRFRSIGRYSELPGILTRKKVRLRNESKSRFSQNREKKWDFDQFHIAAQLLWDSKDLLLSKMCGLLLQKSSFLKVAAHNWAFFVKTIDTVIWKSLLKRETNQIQFSTPRKRWMKFERKKKSKTIQTLMTKLARFTNVLKFADHCLEPYGVFEK